MGMIVFSVIFALIVAFYNWWSFSSSLIGTAYAGLGIFIVDFIVLPVIAIMGGIYGWQFAKKCHEKHQNVAAMLLKLLLINAVMLIPAVLLLIPDGSLAGKNSAKLIGYVLKGLAILLPAYLFASIYYYKNKGEQDEIQKTTPKLGFTTVLAYLLPVVWLVTAYFVNRSSKVALSLDGSAIFFVTVVMSIYFVVAIYCLFRRIVNYYYKSAPKGYVLKTLLWLLLLAVVFGVLVFFLPIQALAGGGIMYVVRDNPWLCLLAVVLPALLAVAYYWHKVHDDKEIAASAEQMRAENPKKNQTVKVVAIVAVVVAAATVIAAVLIWRFRPAGYTIKTGMSFEVNTDQLESSLISDLSDGILVTPNARLDTTAVGEHVAHIDIKNASEKVEIVDVPYNVVDTTPPVIEADDKYTILIYTDANLESLKDYEMKIADNSGKDVDVEFEGEFHRQQEGFYDLEVVATDESGNVARKKITVAIYNQPSTYGYYIKVNRKRNVAIVYWLWKDGEIGGVARTMVTSVGKEGSETPLGKFKISDRYEILYLIGDVWGRYATRIDGHIYFHSVPYFTKGNPHWNDLEYLEYNKLGQAASAGCVRLRLEDARWIYDNVSAGTEVEIYDDDELPEGVEQPEDPIRIDENDTEKRGWDPDDYYDQENPWIRARGKGLV